MARLLREQCQSKTGAPTKRNAKSISSSKASWGGAQQIGFRKESHRTKQVGVGPQQKDFPKESQRTTRVGVAETAL
ncbi:hypothetical protein FH149_09680 [Staphylococcus lugdunensis]|uniref:hypothetical protein n=1 Tax=Staphylococcus lugdunensis TaxID=28035 RepID=UPI0018AFF892|nr:hypothetical protein [Staphylococcus lugdunensis]MCI2845807.1 hypothetical protein [Staphylococcus lugdunensis]